MEEDYLKLTKYRIFFSLYKPSSIKGRPVTEAAAIHGLYLSKKCRFSLIPSREGYTLAGGMQNYLKSLNKGNK